MVLRLSLLPQLLMVVAPSCLALQPKMVQKPSTSAALGPEEPTETLVEAQNAVHVGDCVLNEDTGDYYYEFDVFGSSGHGAIGLAAAAVKHYELKHIELANPDLGDAWVNGPAEANFFGLESESLGEDHMGFPFSYTLDEAPTGADGVTVRVVCSAGIEMVVVVKEEDVNMTVTAGIEEFFDGDEINVKDQESLGPLKGKTKKKMNQGKSPVDFDQASNKKIKIRHEAKNKDTGLAMVDGIFTDAATGKTVRRTFVRESKLKSDDFKKPRKIRVKSVDINDDGDIDVKFQGLGGQNKGATLRVDARLGLDFPGGQAEKTNVVDITAMLDDEGYLTVHGGWMRTKLEELGLTGMDEDDFDVILSDVVVSDPNDGYRVVGRMDADSSASKIPPGQKNKRKKLTSAPTAEEKDISNEMKVGKQKTGTTTGATSRRRALQGGTKRKPRATTSAGGSKPNVRRGLMGMMGNTNPTNAPTPVPTNPPTDPVATTPAPTTSAPTSSAPTLAPTPPPTPGSGIHKKILVHGYCADGNPFPTSEFTDAIEFSDPAGSTGANNWSHDTFAQKIGLFAENNNIEGCGCVAHSQGGAACLHLLTYYFSCLDHANTGTRLIQSVGTPYQGTSLAGNLAAIGDVFGAGCGTNNDLTYAGASQWLAGIPTWARNEVTYFTTSVKDNWWSIDYCHLGTDFFLNDPDDGTTEKDAGQLVGANNGGHKEGYCHTSGMNNDAQYGTSSNTNGAWNGELNTYAMR